MAQRGQRYISQNYWPGFVDALAALLVVVIFLLVVFVLAQIFLSQALSGRDKALEELNLEINMLTEQLFSQKEENINLKKDINSLSASLEKFTSENEQLVMQLDLTKQDVLKFKESFSNMKNRAEQAEKDLVSSKKIINQDKKIIKTYLAEVEQLRQDIEALNIVRSNLEQEVSKLSMQVKSSEAINTSLKTESEELSNTLDETKRLVGRLRNRTASLEIKLEDEKQRTVLAQKEIKNKEIKLASLQRMYLENKSNLNKSKQKSQKNIFQINLLNAQLLALRAQLEALQNSLDQAETKDREQKVMISDLGRRLNKALAQKVEELSKYRSNFFGQLRKVLGNRNDIQIVGDRFVFQSEVLFESGSAELGEAGKQRLKSLAITLIDIIPNIPPNINWILRVDGHTDSQPINTLTYPSNWELSTARATNVAKFLIQIGVPPKRIVAAGFAEYQPIDLNNDEIAFRRNRRIEFKLTQR